MYSKSVNSRFVRIEEGSTIRLDGTSEGIAVARITAQAQGNEGASDKRKRPVHSSRGRTAIQDREPGIPLPGE